VNEFITAELNKGESQENKCHAITMMHSEAGEAYKMSAHHAPLRQSVEEIRLGKD
jgi:hypothetical protein